LSGKSRYTASTHAAKPPWNLLQPQKTSMQATEEAVSLTGVDSTGFRGALPSLIGAGLMRGGCMPWQAGPVSGARRRNEIRVDRGDPTVLPGAGKENGNLTASPMPRNARQCLSWEKLLPCLSGVRGLRLLPFYPHRSSATHTKSTANHGSPYSPELLCS
jgi:hypothetical protein